MRLLSLLPVLLSFSSQQLSVCQSAAGGESHGLSATIRELFTVNKDRAGMDLMRLAQSAGRMVRG